MSGRGLCAVSALAMAWLVVSSPTEASAATGPGPIMAPSASNVTADALPTVQIDGVAWSQAIVGNTVYVGGSFAHARPYGAAVGTNQVTRQNMLSYNLQTGVLVTSFAPNVNGQVLAVAASPNGSVLYAAGNFTTVNGISKSHIAAFNATSGALITTFHASTNAQVRSIIATNTTVYAGGLFTVANGVARNRLAAFTATTGAVTAWKPNADSNVYALVLTPDGTKVVVGGAFLNLNSAPVYGLGALNVTTGASVPWATNQVVRDYGSNSGIWSLATDGTAIYGTGYNFNGVGNLEGAFSANPTTGVLKWLEDCHGDTYDVFAINGIAYTVSHAHFCANDGGWPVTKPWEYRHSVAFTAAVTGTLLHNSQTGYPDFYGRPSPSIINWFPDFLTGTYTGQGQAAWTVTGNSQYLVEGGEFPAVNNKPQQGLVRFAVRGIAPGTQGPRLSGASYVPTLTALSSTSVRISIASNWDRDDLSLTYKVVRNGNISQPIWTTTGNSEFWNRPTRTFTNTGLTPGATYNYRFYVSDPHGNTVSGNAATITVPS
jgi:hypothetical protein